MQRCEHVFFSVRYIRSIILIYYYSCLYIEWSFFFFGRPICVQWQFDCPVYDFGAPERMANDKKIRPDRKAFSAVAFDGVQLSTWSSSFMMTIFCLLYLCDELLRASS